LRHLTALTESLIMKRIKEIKWKLAYEEINSKTEHRLDKLRERVLRAELIELKRACSLYLLTVA
jgi:DNA-binding transcriptional ArsR family regulator